MGSGIWIGTRRLGGRGRGGSEAIRLGKGRNDRNRLSETKRNGIHRVRETKRKGIHINQAIMSSDGAVGLAHL